MIARCNGGGIRSRIARTLQDVGRAGRAIREYFNHKNDSHRLTSTRPTFAANRAGSHTRVQFSVSLGAEATATTASSVSLLRIVETHLSQFGGAVAYGREVNLGHWDNIHINRLIDDIRHSNRRFISDDIGSSYVAKKPHDIDADKNV